MKTDREKLTATLARLKPAIKNGGLLLEMSHIWFAGSGAYAFNGELGIRVGLDSGLECGVPGDVLLNLLGTSSLPEASLDQTDAGLTLRLGKSTSKLAAMSLDRGMWPFPKSKKGDESGEELTKGLLEALARVLVVEAKQAVARVEHKGVLVYESKKGAALCATDSASLALARTDAKLGEAAGRLVPYALAEQVVRSCAAGDRVVFKDDYLAATASSVALFHRGVDASDAQDVLAVAEKLAAKHPEPVPIPHGFGIALERAAILDSGEDTVVGVELEGATLRVLGKYKHGELDERITIKGGEHPPARGRFLVKLLQRGLKGVKTMSVDDQALIMHDGPGFMYAVAQRRAETTQRLGDRVA